MSALATNSSKLPTHIPAETEVWNARHGGPAFRFSSAAVGSSYAAGVTGGSCTYGTSPSSLSSSSSTGSTRRDTQIAGHGSPSSGQTSHHGSLSELEADLEEGSTERMESLVSGLLQDDGREYHASAAVRPAVADVLRDSSCDRGPSLEPGGRRIKQSSRMLYQDCSANGGFVGPRADRGCDADQLSTNMRLSKTTFATYGDSFEENWSNQTLNDNEAAIRASLLQGSLSPNPEDNVDLSYFSDSQQSGFGILNSNVHLTPPTREQAYAVQREIDGVAIRNREYANELQAMKNLELLRNLHAHAAYTAELLTGREALRQHERLISDLQVIAESMAQSAIVERNSAERTNGALVALCKWLYERGCATSDAELEKVKTDIREACQLRAHHQNLHSIQCYPAAGHVKTSQPQLATNFSSPRPTTINNRSAFPESGTYNNSSAPARPRSVAPPSFGLVQPIAIPYARSRSLGNTSERKSFGHHMHFASPPKRISSPRNNRARAAHAARAAENDSMRAKGTAKLLPRTPTRVSAFPSASPPVKRGSHENAMAGISSVNNVQNYADSFQTSMSEQRSVDRDAFVVQTAGSSNCCSTPARLSHDSPATKVLIAQGVKSISILLKSRNSTSGGRNSYPAAPYHDRPAAETADSGSVSPIRPRRLDMSDKDGSLQLVPIEHPSVELDVCNQGQFKTELCNNWQETQFCPYGEHCRFAHGVEELRCVLRHPRYKTIPCRMIMDGKACIYGHRCHFRHSLTSEELSPISIIDVHDPAAAHGHGRALKSVVS